MLAQGLTGDAPSGLMKVAHPVLAQGTPGARAWLGLMLAQGLTGDAPSGLMKVAHPVLAQGWTLPSAPRRRRLGGGQCLMSKVTWMVGLDLAGVAVHAGTCSE